MKTKGEPTRRNRQFVNNPSTIARNLSFLRRCSSSSGFWACLVVLPLITFRTLDTRGGSSAFRFDFQEHQIVQRVIDGDTLLLRGDVRVRLLGVNTPETKHPTQPVAELGLETFEFVRRHVEGHSVTLTFDRERRDKYRRVLSYVYVGDWFLNEELIAAGYSRAETRFPYSSVMKRRFRLAEREARDEKRGMWANKP